MAAKKLSFEEKLSRLEEIVAALEKGDAPAEDVTTAILSGNSGRGFLRPSSKSPSLYSRSFSCSKASARSPAPSGVMVLQ